jgi:hypothetical protein
MKRSFPLILFFTLSFVCLSAQDVFLQDESQSVEEKARALTENYQPELVMTGTQTRLFERKVGEFLIRGDEIKKMDISTRDKLHLLGQLSAQESAEIVNILSRPQVKRYMKIKSALQPIAMVVDTVKNKK